MVDTRLTIGGRYFSVTCQPGEEEHLARLGKLVDEMASKAPGGLTESRMLLFAALFLADRVAEMEDEARKKAGPAVGDLFSDGNAQAASTPDEKTLQALENLADRMEKLAQALE